MSDIKTLMKQIIMETNTVLKRSSTAFKKIKENRIVLTDKQLKPTEKTSVWFYERGFTTITLPEFFDLVFKEASEKNMLDLLSKSIMFDEKDAIVFDVEPHTKIHILTFFEHIPKYFI